MPAIRESSGETPAILEVVEVRPGVRLKLNAADKKAMLDVQAADAETRRQWNLVNAGVVDNPATETVVAGAAVDGPSDAPSTDAPDAEEAAVTAAPRSRKK